MNNDLNVDSSISLAYLNIVLLKIKIITLKYLNDLITPAPSLVTDKKSTQFYAVDDSYITPPVQITAIIISNLV